MKRFFSAILVCAVLMSFAPNAQADQSLMQGYEKLRKTSELRQKQSRNVKDLLTLVSYQMGNVYLSPILSRNSDSDTLGGSSKMPKIGLTVTVPLGKDERSSDS